MRCVCGVKVRVGRVRLGYSVCLDCGDKQAVAKSKQYTVAPINKSNYMLITDLQQLKQLNPKRTT